LEIILEASKDLSDERLLEIAHEAKENSLAKFSKYRVGAALTTSDGKVYTGSNIENNSLSLSICAERVALFKALSEGKRDFLRIAVVNDKKIPCPPCGTCRQVLYEFAPNVKVVMEDKDGALQVIDINELLPYPFKP
jgi:cytidine deaminase